MTPLSLAFLPLTDAAPLIVAGARGFAAEAGIELDLVRTTSWATLRDRLVYGQVQGAHMLAPLAIAVTLGLSQAPAALSAPFRLNVNGNALAMAPDFAAALEPDPAQRVADPLAAAHDFATAIGLHHRKPVVGIVHRFSSQALLLRYWLAAAGTDLGTPWAEKTTGASSGTSSSSSTKTAPIARSRSTTNLLWTISCRT